VVADLVDLAREAGSGHGGSPAALGVGAGGLRDLPVIPMAEVESPWYLRMEAEDKPGVLSSVASLFSDQGISIEALIQKAPAAGQTLVPLIVVTNRARQGSVQNAVSAIEALDTINGKVTRIRVEELDG
jgi:homoserine dehydrogenase